MRNANDISDACHAVKEPIFITKKGDIRFTEEEAMLRMMQEHEFDMVFSLMEKSFPEDEYRPYEEQKALLLDKRYSIYVLPDSNGEEVKAFIAVWRIADFAFLEHFAVNPNYRNQGLGALILKDIKELFACQICLEVELPQTDFAIRRIGFYERNGFFLNHYAYMQPPISGGRHEIPLWVMTSGQAIAEERFEYLKKTIYREVYKYGI